MSKEILLMIIGMGVVTYIPRMLPFILFRGREWPKFLRGILTNVPYAILGALIFPGILFIQEDMIYGVIGALVAFFIAFLGANVFVVVIGSIAILSVFSYFL